MERPPYFLRYIVITDSVLHGESELVLGNETEEILVVHAGHALDKL